MIRNLPQAQGYCDSKGLYAARKAVMQRTQQQGIQGVDVEDVFIGNGVSELIVMAMQGLINDGDEVLVPARTTPLDCGGHPRRREGRALPLRRGLGLASDSKIWRVPSATGAS